MAKFLYLSVLILYSVLVACSSRYIVSISNERTANIKILLLVLVLGIIVAFRPTDIVPDSVAYYDRYYEAPKNISFSEIVKSSNFYRCPIYEMSIVVSSLFFLSAKMQIPYGLFVTVIVLVEMSLYFFYSRKILAKNSISYDDSVLLACLLVFYSVRYQLIAFAQGMSMCFATQILFYILEKKNIKLILICLLASSFHIGGLFFLPLSIILVISKKKNILIYLLMWLISGVMMFTTFGFKMGTIIDRFAAYFIRMITNHVPVYSFYSEPVSVFSFSFSGFLFWLLCGLLLLVYIENDLYWKLINVNLFSLVIRALFGRWEVVHRFTDVARMYVPLLIVLYLYYSLSFFSINRETEIERASCSIALLFGLISGLHLMQLL